MNNYPETPINLNKINENISKLVLIMEQLRDKQGGCEWDLEQTYETIAPYTIEEAYEVVEAIYESDMDKLCDELGDLLLQVVFHAQIAKENGNFDIEDVARGISDKLVRRHPHVFGDEKGTIDQADQVVDRWEQVKAEEKKQKGISNENSSIFKKLPPRLPALLFANDIYKRAEKADVDDRLSLDKGKIDSMAQNMDQEKAGRALFELVAACRKSGLDPEACLRDFASKQMQDTEDNPA